MEQEQELEMDKTHVVMLLDESGSMSPHRLAVVKSFNKYVKNLRAETKRCYISLYKFDTRSNEKGDGLVRALFENRKVKDCYELTVAQYLPYGGTPLYDAVGQLIKATKKRLPKEAKVLFVVHTDGEENASREYTKESVKKMIEKCEKKRGWTFIYLGEGQQAWNAGYQFGIQNVANYSSNLRGMAMDKLSTVTCYVANTAKADVAGSHTLYGSAGISSADDIDSSEVQRTAT